VTSQHNVTAHPEPRRAIAVAASQPMHMGGAMDVPALEKHLALIELAAGRTAGCQVAARRGSGPIIGIIGALCWGRGRAKRRLCRRRCVGCPLPVDLTCGQRP